MNEWIRKKIGLARKIEEKELEIQQIKERDTTLRSELKKEKKILLGLKLQMAAFVIAIPIVFVIVYGRGPTSGWDFVLWMLVVADIAMGWIGLRLSEKKGN